MRIAVVSDTHFGFKWNSERREDCFRNSREAFKKAKEADAVLLPGDIFDTKTPSQEVFSRVFNLFEILDERREGVAELDDNRWDDERLPVIAIHGTHERRSKENVNPIELLEDAGLLLHLHNDSLKLVKGNEIVNIYGMSGVPERYASKVLKRWDPEPSEGFNILMLHQSIEGFVYTDDIAKGISMSDIPDGFDYVINGHIHWKNLKYAEREPSIILPGSTITTQIRKKEVENSKGILFIDTETGEISFEEINSSREAFRKEIDVTGLEGREIVDEAVEKVEELASDFERKPLVRIILTGKTDASFSKKEIRDKVDNAIISIGEDLEKTDEDIEKIDPGQDIDEMGLSIMEEGFGFQGLEEMFEKLVNGDVEDILEDFEEKDLEDVEEFVQTTEDEEDGGEEQTDQKKNQGSNVMDYF